MPPPAGTAPMPELIRPMLASVGELPPSSRDAEYAYEMKWDGVRAVVYVGGGRLRVVSRNDRDVAVSYPELRGIEEPLSPHQAVLDGEIIALDPATGRVSFGILQQRMHVQDRTRAGRLAERFPVALLAFDVLFLDGRVTMALPYVERRRLLEGLELQGAHWDTPPYFAGGGEDVLAASKEQGLEGVMAKRLTCPYEPGTRSRDWLKIKNVRTQEVVIGGWQPGEGSRANTIGSLMLGLPDDGGLRYVGNVGTGFTQATLRDLERTLAPLSAPASPFNGPLPPRLRNPQWVRPELVGEVQYGEWTRDGRLRHPSWRGLRPDKSPDEVVRE